MVIPRYAAPMSNDDIDTPEPAAEPAPPPGLRMEHIRLGEIIGAERNVKKHALDELMEAVNRFSFMKPIQIDDRTGRLYAGHGRRDILVQMKSMGLAPPDGITLDDDGEWLVPAVRGWASKDDHEAAAAAIADNQVGVAAGYDEAELARVLEELRTQSEEGLAGTGFDEAAVSRLLDSLGAGAPATDGDVPKAPKVPVARRGDLWQLGDHRLYCGSCEDAVAQYGEGVAKLLITDPPYGVDYAAKNAAANAKDGGNRIETPIIDDDHAPDEMETLWTRWFSSFRPCMAPGASFYVTGPQGGLRLLLLLCAMRASRFSMMHELMWLKDQLVFGRADYHYRHEPIIYGWVEGAAHHAVEDRTQDSVWEIPRPKVSDLHPTMKPVELYARAMRNSSNRGDVVLEPFAGSGTGIIAGEQTGRTVYATELSAAYCDVIIERWQQESGKKAVRLVQGAGGPDPDPPPPDDDLPELGDADART